MGVPQVVWRFSMLWPKCSGSALSPKSLIFSRPQSSSSKFSGLRSRWQTPRSWQKPTASTSCRKYGRASSSVNLPLATILSKSSPPVTSSRTMKMVALLAST